MTGRRGGVQWRYIVGGLMLLIAIPMVPWNRHFGADDIVIGLAGVAIILGYRRIFRAAVSRPTAEEVVCRFAPWYEGYAYIQLMIPLLALAATVQGFTSGPKWMGYSGILVLLLAPIFIFGLIFARRRCVVSVTPSMLTIRGAGPVAEIQREQVEAITPFVGPQRLDPRQVQITYRPGGPRAETVTKVLPGLQLTVEPDNLLHALEDWKDPLPNESPSELMDRVEAILRGRATTEPNHEHWTKTG